MLSISLVLTLSFVIMEAFAGIRAHSLALLSDAGHNFIDAFALLLALIGQAACLGLFGVASLTDAQ